jgi:hypothetical protein
VARPGLVRCQRPRDRIESEVIVFVLRAARSGGNIQGRHELAALTGVVHERRGNHVRRRHLRGLGRRGEPNNCRAVGQCNQIFRDDDPFNLLQSFLENGRIASPVICCFLSSAITAR